MECLSDIWAFPAGAGRAVAVSRIKFPEPADIRYLATCCLSRVRFEGTGLIRVRSASAPYSHRIRTLRASIPNANATFLILN